MLSRGKVSAKTREDKNSSSVRLELYLTWKWWATLTIRVDPKSLVFYATRKSLREMAERLADKYEEAKEKQEDIMNRSVYCITFSSLLKYSYCC